MTRVAGKSPANGAKEKEKAARQIQAAAEGANAGDTITWKGETFRLEEGDLPGAARVLMAQMAAAYMTSVDPQSEDAARQIMEMCLKQPSGIPPGGDGFDPAKYDPGDYPKFMRHFAKTRATVAEMMDAVQAAVEALAVRPTMPPPSSSNGRPAITASSTGT